MKKTKFPGQDQIKKALLQIKESESQEGISVILSKNVPPIERFKYLLCKEILRYKRKRNFSNLEMASLLQIDAARVSEIMNAKIHLYSLDKLLGYVSALGVDDKIIKNKIEKAISIFEA